MKEIMKSIRTKLKKLFSPKLYNKLDKWWINEIEVPISGDDVPEDYDKESVSYRLSVVWRGAECKEPTLRRV